MRLNVKSLVIAAALSALLAACGATSEPEPEPEQPSLSVSLYTGGGFDPFPPQLQPLAAAFAVIDPAAIADELVEGSLEAAALTVIESIALGALTPVGEDGAVTVTLPTPEDVEPFLVPAEDLLIAFQLGTCQVNTSVAGVHVTPVMVQLVFGVPGVLVLTPMGLLPTIISAEPIAVFDEETLVGMDFYSALYADAAVGISFAPADCPGFPYTIDLSLEAGWNTVSWRIVTDELGDLDGYAVSSAAAPEALYAAPASILYASN